MNENNKVSLHQNLLTRIKLNKFTQKEETEYLNKILRPKHLVMDERNNYINTNKTLFREFNSMKKRDIYTTNRYGIRYHVTNLDHQIAQRGWEIKRQMQHQVIDNYVDYLKRLLRQKKIANNKNQSSSFNGTLPAKLNLDLLKAPTIHPDQSPHNPGERVLGKVTPEVILANLSNQKLSLNKLIKYLKLDETDLIKSSDGRWFVSREKLLTRIIELQSEQSAFHKFCKDPLTFAYYRNKLAGDEH